MRTEEGGIAKVSRKRPSLPVRGLPAGVEYMNHRLARRLFRILLHGSILESGC
jgi:hypothetical protein